MNCETRISRGGASRAANPNDEACGTDRSPVSGACWAQARNSKHEIRNNTANPKQQRRGRWSAVECKRCRRLPRRPLQRPADPKVLPFSRPPLRAGVIRPHHVSRRSGRRSARLEPTDGGTARAPSRFRPLFANRYSPIACIQSPLARLFPHAAVYPGLARCARFGRGYFQSPLCGSPGHASSVQRPAPPVARCLLPDLSRCPLPVACPVPLPGLTLFVNRHSPFANRPPRLL
jgi:hypothetical protein